MLLAQDVLQAYTRISISMMVVFTSLRAEGREGAGGGVRVGDTVVSGTRFRGPPLLGHRLDHEDIFASHRLLDLHPRFYGNNKRQGA